MPGKVEKPRPHAKSNPQTGLLPSGRPSAKQTPERDTRSMGTTSEPISGFSRGGLKKQQNSGEGKHRRRRMSVTFGNGKESSTEVMEERYSRPPSASSRSGSRPTSAASSPGLGPRLSQTAVEFHGHAKALEANEAHAFRFGGRRNSESSLSMSRTASLTEASPDAHSKSDPQVGFMEKRLLRRHSESSLTKGEGDQKDTLQSVSRASTPMSPLPSCKDQHRRPSNPQVPPLQTVPAQSTPAVPLTRPEVPTRRPLSPLVDKILPLAMEVSGQKGALEAAEDLSGSDTSTLCPETSVAGSSADF